MKLVAFFGIALVAGTAMAGAPDSAEAKRVKEMNDFFRQQGRDDAEIAERAIKSAKDSVRATLTDPDSANFRGVFFSNRGDYVCGEVNAKNKFGGYAGYRRFFSNGSVAGLDNAESAFFEIEWRQRCTVRPE